MTHAELLNHATAFAFPLSDGGTLHIQKTVHGFSGRRSYPRPHPMAMSEQSITRDGSIITNEGWMFHPKPESGFFPTLDALMAAVNAFGSANAVPPSSSGVFAVIPALDKSTQTTDSRDYSSELGCRGISDQRL